MSTTDPIRDPEKLTEFINYYLHNGNLRNYAFINVGLYTALRVSDLLSLKWGDIYDFKNDTFNRYIYLVEKKTHKKKLLPLNEEVLEALIIYKDSLDEVEEETPLFESQKGKLMPITREHAFRIIKTASSDIGLTGNISCHSLRKTFGYWACKNGVQPGIIMKIFNHSSYEITKRYVCIDQDETDEVYMKISFTNFKKGIK